LFIASYVMLTEEAEKWRMKDKENGIFLEFQNFTFRLA